MRLFRLLVLILIPFSISAQSSSPISWADSTFDALKEPHSHSNSKLQWLSDSVESIYLDANRLCEALEVRGWRGDYERASGTYEKGLQTLISIIDDFPKDCDSSIYRNALLDIIRVYYDIQDFQKYDSTTSFAEQHFTLEDSSTYVDLLIEKGILDVMKGNMNTSRELFYKAARLASSPSGKYRAYGSLGIYYFMLVQSDTSESEAAANYRDSAISYYQRSLQLTRKHGDVGDKPTLYNALAGLYSNNPELQGAYIDSAIEIAQRDENLADLPVYLKNKGHYLTSIGAYEKASLWFQEEYIPMQDSIYNESRLKAIAEVEERFQSKLKAEENRRLNTELQLKEESLQKSQTITAVVSVGILAILIVLGLLFNSHRKVQRERKASDALLLNILPGETAKELKDKGYTTAHRFEHTTVLFADIKDFTQKSESMSAEQLVQELDTYFRAFDEIVYAQGLEKIKSIGDAYICAAGLPETNSSDAKDAVRAALAMQAKANEIKEKRIAEGQAYFEFRCGIHTGPVVGGVVGIKKWQYDIWGDTVNLAARMEQSSEPGKINISQVTFDLVQNDFRCISRGKIHAKNKGELDMYYVEKPMA